VLVAVLDDSGSRDDKGMLHGGLVLSEQDFLTLEELWQTGVLDKHNLREFHAREIRGIIRSRETLNALEADIVQVLLRVRPRFFARGLEYHALAKAAEENEWFFDPNVTPDCFCIEQCLHTISRLVNEKAPDDSFILFYDELRPHLVGPVATLLETYRRDVNGFRGGRFLGALPASRKQMLSLQGADFLANAYFRELRRALTPEPWGTSPLLLRLLGEPVHRDFAGYYDSDAFEIVGRAFQRGGQWLYSIRPNSAP